MFPTCWFLKDHEEFSAASTSMSNTEADIVGREGVEQLVPARPFGLLRS
jgi:hypothetical protein